MLVILFVQVLTRTFFNYSNHWSEEYARYCNIFLIYISSALAAKRKKHIRVDVVLNVWPKKIRRYVAEVGNYIWIAFNLLMAKVSIDYIIYLKGVNSTSQALNIPLWCIYLALPIGFILMTVRLLVNQINSYKHWNDVSEPVPVAAESAVKEER